MTRDLLRSALFVLLAASSASAHAQGYPDGFGQMWMDTTAVGSAMKDAAGAANKVVRSPVGKRDRVDITRLKDRSSNKAAISSLVYRPSLERRRANLAQFVTKTRAADPAGADQLQAMFASTDIIEAIGGEIRKYGLRTDNVADAYAMWWMVAWYAVQGRESDPSAGPLAAVRRQAASALLASGSIERATESAKQEMAEALLVQAALVDAANDKMRGDPDQRRALSAAVNKGARAMGLDLTSMTLSPDGFRVRQGSDAGEAIQAMDASSAPIVLAASAEGAAPAPIGESRAGTATYALVAAVGGAGLAAMFMMGRVAGQRGS